MPDKKVLGWAYRRGMEPGRGQGEQPAGGRRGPSAHDLTTQARQAAQDTFRRFQDIPGSLYYEAPGMEPMATWEAIREEVGAVSVLAAVRGAAKQDITPEDLLAWHRGIFGNAFPDSSGQLRDHAELYGYVIGRKEKPEPRVGRGTSWRKVPERLQRICDDFNAEANRLDPLTADDGLRLVDVTVVAATLYTKFLSIHPFEDGNGRTAFAVLCYALIRLEAIAVELADYRELQFALGKALKPGGSGSGYTDLAELFAQKIRTARSAGLP